MAGRQLDGGNGIVGHRNPHTGSRTREAAATAHRLQYRAERRFALRADGRDIGRGTGSGGEGDRAAIAGATARSAVADADGEGAEKAVRAVRGMATATAHALRVDARRAVPTCGNRSAIERRRHAAAG
ncbi:hypothetical protein D3C85_1099470 [compost metagenome]